MGCDAGTAAGALRLGLLQEGFAELPVRAPHVLAVQHLPWHRRNPFDRLLVAQAAEEGLHLSPPTMKLAGGQGT